MTELEIRLEFKKDINDVLTRLNKLAKCVLKLSERIEVLEKENKHLKEKAWMYDELCK